MCSILPQNIATAQQFSAKNPVVNSCLKCSCINFKRNGIYARKVRISSSKVQIINIQRYYCYRCKSTFSALPAHVPVRRWYVWDVQQQALGLQLLLYSTNKIAQQLKLARSTIRRWLSRLKERFIDHADALKQQLPNILGLAVDFTSFWKACLDNCTLTQAMVYLRNTGITVP